MAGERAWIWTTAIGGALVLVAGILAAALPAGGRAGSSRGRPPLVEGAAGDPSPSPAPVPPPEDLLPLSDPQSLDLAAAGYELPPTASVYAARIVDHGPGRPLAYVDFVAGGGADAHDFWPASTVKLLVALAALDFAATLGFTGAATVSLETGYSATLREIYQSAIARSDNFDYDTLLRIAGFDRLNDQFLSPAHGFPTTVIQRSYAGVEVRWSPAMTLEEGGRAVLVPAREGTGDYGCPDEGNCTSLFELSESVRRLLLDASIPARERFAIDPADVAGLSDALAEAGSFFVPAAEHVLGPDARVYGKPGVATGRDCVDVALVSSPAGDRYLLSAVVPDSGSELECEELYHLGEAVLAILAGADPPH